MSHSVRDCWARLLVTGLLILVVYLLFTATRIQLTTVVSSPRLQRASSPAGAETRKFLERSPRERARPNGTYDCENFPAVDIPRLSYSHLPRALSPDAYNQTISLLGDVIDGFVKHNVTYMIAFGTLLGSYMTHDILPWDDDIDLLVPLSDRNKVLKIFQSGEINSTVNKNHPSRMIKLFYKNGKKLPYPWKWPFIDVMHYKADEKKMTFDTDEQSSSLHLKYSQIFPLHKRPFAGMCLWSMNDPLTFLKVKYGDIQCRSGGWNHQHEKRQTAVRADCGDVVDHYPLVYRNMTAGGVLETLRLKGEDLYTMYVKDVSGKVFENPFHV